MATDIVQSLFGPSPYDIQRAQRAVMDNTAWKYAQAAPFEAARAGLFSAAGGLAGAGAEALGMVNPQVEQARATEQALTGIDTSNPDSILQRAQQVQDPRLKMRLTQYAQQMKAQQQKALAEQQQAALATRKQDFAETSAFELKKQEAEARIRQNDERIRDARTTAEERAALAKESNDIKRLLGMAMIEQRRAAAADKANKPKAISNVDAKSIDKSLATASGANSALQLLDQADALYTQYASGRDEPILGGAARWGAAIGIGDPKRASDYEVAGQIAKDLGVIKLGLIGGSDTERELQVAIDTSPSPDKLPSTNKTIIANQRRAIEVLQAEPDFKTEWVNKHGSLSAVDKGTGETYGKAWRKYQKENFKPVVNPGDVGKPAKPQQASGGLSPQEQAELDQLRKRFNK